MIKKIFFLLLFFPLIVRVQAQISVTDSENLVDIVKRLQGPGVKISNISYRISPKATKKPAGYFTDEFGVIGLDHGLLLTNGAALNALGPNNVPDVSQDNKDSLQDPDLTPYIEAYNPRNTLMEDECVVEFDLISSYPVLSFNYIFASEEYIEFLNYHDVFAFLISGPGIAGQKNIALVPHTNIPVSVASINPNKNSQYYISNGSGSTPFINIDMQYDGYTTVLKATSNVIPCETYHIKLTIADVSDGALDSGVFIEEGSFKSDNFALSVVYQYPRFKTAIEGCNNAKVILKRPTFSVISERIKYKILVKGNAGNGIDYTYIADSIIIPAGIDSGFISIEPFADGILDDNEFVRIILESQCPNFPNLDSIDVPIKEKFLYTIPSEKICSSESVKLNKFSVSTDSVRWNESPYLDCKNCPSPTAAPPFSKRFFYSIKDNISGCTTKDSLLVEVIKLKADFNFKHDPCYTNNDFFFINNSQNASSYTWDFGDHTSSDKISPLHQFPFLNKDEQETYKVTLIVRSEHPSCSADTSVIITIQEPLFITNLITANNDSLNNTFKILGIGKGCWSVNIYNRWGGLIFKNENYNNDFPSKEISEGVYFYNVYNSYKDREFKGWMQIIK